MHSCSLCYDRMVSCLSCIKHTNPLASSCWRCSPPVCHLPQCLLINHQPHRHGLIRAVMHASKCLLIGLELKSHRFHPNPYRMCLSCCSFKQQNGCMFHRNQCRNCCTTSAIPACFLLTSCFVWLILQRQACRQQPHMKLCFLVLHSISLPAPFFYL